MDDANLNQVLDLIKKMIPKRIKNTEINSACVGLKGKNSYLLLTLICSINKRSTPAKIK